MTLFVNQSLHSKIRINQRGIRNTDLEAIYSFSDREKPIGKGKTSLSISKKRLRKLVTEGEMCPQQADRVRGKVIIWGESNDNGAAKVVTAFRPYGKTSRKFC